MRLVYLVQNFQTLRTVRLVWIKRVRHDELSGGIEKVQLKANL